MKLRSATAQDEDLLLRWWNDQSNRSWCFEADPVSPDAWFRLVVDYKNSRLYIGESDDGRPIGLMMFLRRPDGVAEVSLIVTAEGRSGGYVSEFFQLGCKRALDDPWGVTQIEARVKSSNLRAISLLKWAGFREIETVFGMGLGPL